MTIEGFDDFSAFNPAQIITATSSIAASISELRTQTLDEDITDREAHAIMLIGTRTMLERSGAVKLEPMTATRFVEMLQTNFDVSDTAAENDYKRLKEIGLLECVPSPDDGRVRLVVLTELGENLYQVLGERVACLILALADCLRQFGAVPADPKETIKPFLKNYALKLPRT